MDTKFVALLAVAAGLAGCSKAVVSIPEKAVLQEPVPTAPVAAVPPAVAAPSQSDRIVEIDRMLSEPLTGSPKDADRRSSLRAERTALAATGNYAMAVDQAPRQSGSDTVIRDAHGDFVNYGPPPPSNDQIVVAVDSQGRSGYLPFLESLTPSERHHYFEALWLQNSQNININRNIGFARGRFHRRF